MHNSQKHTNNPRLQPKMTGFWKNKCSLIPIIICVNWLLAPHNACYLQTEKMRNMVVCQYKLSLIDFLTVISYRW